MLNLKTKSMLMGATSFLMAFLVLTVLTVVNKETKDGLSFLKTAVTEKTVSLGVCSQLKNVSTGGTCDVTDSETFTATAGTYDLYGDITRGPADQTEESFELSLNGISLGNFADDGVDGVSTKVLLKSGVSVLEANTLLMTHLAPNSDVTKPNSVSITKIYLENNATEPVASPASCTAIASLTNVTSASETSYITWTSTNATSMKAECTGPVATGNIDWYVDQAASPFPSGYPAHFDAGMVGTEVCTFYPYNSAGTLGTTCSANINVNISGSCPVAAVNSFIANPTSITAGESSTLSWTTTNATSCKVLKQGGTNPYYDNDGGSGTITVTPASAANFDLTCWSTCSGSETSPAVSKSVSVNVSSTSYSCTGTVPSNASLCSSDSTGLTADTAITLKSACTDATKCEYTCSSDYSYDSTTGACVANTYSCTGTVPSNASLCSSDSTDLTADTAITLKSACTDATKCEYTCSSGYGYDSTTGACVASTNGSCGTASKTYSSSSTSYGTDTFCTAGTASPTSPTFPTTSSSTSWSCVGSNGGTTSSCKASLSSVVTNGACGSADGDTFSSTPNSDLCSEGNASSVSGSGPWTWTCSGINGGSSVSCSADITTTTYTYSPTVSVIPVTEYTYSYTSKVAPTSGPATNVALLLSISAVVTLGVWMAVKKIKG